MAMEENALVRFTGDAADLASVIQSLVDAVNGLSNAFMQVAETATESLQSITEDITAVTQQIGGIGEALGGVAEAAAQMGTDVAEAFGYAAESAAPLTQATATLTESMATVAAGMGTVAQAAETMATATGADTEATLTDVEALKAEYQALQDSVQAWQMKVGKLQDAIAAYQAAAGAEDEQTTALQAEYYALSNSTEAWQAKIDRLQASIAATQQQAEADTELTAAEQAQAEATAQMAAYVASLDQALAGTIPQVAYASDGTTTWRQAIEDTMPAELQQEQNLMLLQMGYKDTAQGLSDAGDMARITGYQMLLLAGILLQVSRSFITLGVQAQDQLSIVAALTGTSTQQMGAYTDQLIQMAEAMGMPLAEAAQGLYYVVSAGYVGAQAFPVLAVAMQDAISSGTDFKQVTDALTAAMRAYGVGADQATHYSDMMIAAVRDGKQTFEEFSHDIGIAAETGKNAGFSFQQVAAAESSLTEFGFPAAQAMRDLDVVMRTIGGSSAPVVEAQIKKAGVAFDFAKFYASDLFGRLQMLYDALGSNHKAFQAAVGGAWGYQAAVSIVSDKTGTFLRILHDLNTASGSTTTAFQTSEQRLSAGAQHMGASLSVLSYQLVTLITPALRPMLEGLGKAFAWVAQQVQQHSIIVIPLLASIAAIIGGTVVAAIVALVGMMGSALAAAGPIIMAVAAGVAGFVRWVMMVQQAISSHKDLQRELGQLVQAIQPFLHVMSDLGHTLLPLIMGALQKVGQFLAEYMARELQIVLPILITLATWISTAAVFLQAHLAPTVQAIGGHLRDFAGGVLHVAEAIGSRLGPPLHVVIGLIGGLLGILGHVAGFLGGVLGGALGIAGNALHAIGGAGAGFMGFLGHLLQIAGQVGTFLRDGLATDLGLVQRALGWLWNAVQPVIHAIQSALKPAADALGSTLNTQLKPALAGVGDIAHNIGQFFGSLWQIIQQFLNMGLIVTMFRGFGIVFHLLGVGIQWAMGHLRDLLGILGSLLRFTFLGLLFHGLGIAFHFIGMGVQFLVPLIGQLVSWIGDHLAPVIHFVLGGLRLLWSFLAPVLMPVLHGLGIVAGVVGNMLHGALGMVLEAVANTFSGVFHAALLAGSFVLGLLVGALNGVLHALGMVLAGIIMFVGGAIRFFIGWVQFIVALISGFVRIIADIVTGHFDRLGKDIQQIWHSIQQALGNIIGGMVGMVKGLFTGLFGSLIAFAQNFLGGFLGVFGNLFHTITGTTIPNIVSGIKNGFLSLPGDMLKMGADIIQHLISGILSKLGDVGKAVGNVAQKIRDFFPHSPPKEGPLTDLEKYGPTLVQMVATGILSNVRTIQTAAQAAAQAAHSGLTGSARTGAGFPTSSGGLGALTSQGSAQTSLLAGILGQLRAGAGGAGSSPAGQVFLDNRPPMGITQQFGTINFNGIGQLQAAYQALTRMAGQAQENANRGALAGLPFS